MKKIHLVSVLLLPNLSNVVGQVHSPLCVYLSVQIDLNLSNEHVDKQFRQKSITKSILGLCIVRFKTGKIWTCTKGTGLCTWEECLSEKGM